jgi:purine-nucleoside phosphorylase
MIHKIDETANYIRQCLGSRPMPQIAIILGSGLGLMADRIEDPLTIPYAGIPNFKRSTAIGHKGNLIIGILGGKNVMAMQGRFHYYEGYNMQEVTFPVRVMARLGIKTLFVSNAAGAVNPTYRVGDMMVITDHINFFPENPLRGKNMPTGPRFPDMHEAYDRTLITLADDIARDNDIKLQHGVYLGLQGPSYETPAEYRAFHMWGADAVGMSTVPEVIVARHCGIKVFGISIITNIGLSDVPTEATHEEVTEAANSVQPRMTKLIREMVARC